MKSVLYSLKYSFFPSLLPGLPAVITLFIGAEAKTCEGAPLAEAVKQLEAAGAAVVGINCCRGPRTMIHLLPRIRDAVKVTVRYEVFNK